VSCGDLHTLAMKEDGKLYAWGHGSCGALGNKDLKDLMVPTLVEDAPAVVDIAAGSMFSLVVSVERRLYSCGEGSSGRLGLGDLAVATVADRFQCIENPLLDNVTSLVVGEYHAGCIVNGEELYTWGSNKDGQLGHGDFENRTSPTFVEAFRGTPVLKVASGAAHMIAIKHVKKLRLDLAYSWGSNACGQLGQGPTAEKVVNSPHPLTGQFGQQNVDHIVCGAFHSALMRAAPKVAAMEEKDGEEDEKQVELYLWGNNTYGQLGLGQADSVVYSTPTLNTAKPSKNCRMVYCGGFHTVAAIGATWIHDEEATNCMNCKNSFTMINRRHHCRHCGGVYCAKCSSKKIPLLKFGLAEPQRVCDKCYGKVRGE
jgi:alpha-tubulin suppressor-like RCC1 family protein